MINPKKSWAYASLVPFGPLLGWLVHDHFFGDELRFLGIVVMIAWCGFFFVKVLMHCDWNEHD